MILFPDQAQLRTDIGASMRKHRKLCVQAPTGSGKTVVFSDIVHRYLARDARVLILVPRRELAHQAVGSLSRFGRDIGYIMAGEPMVSGYRCYVASFDTLHARCIQRDMFSLPAADVIIVDEAHLCLAQTRRDILDAYPEARIIGFTATPSRGDGKGLRQMFDDLVIGPSIAELIKLGRLVPPHYFAGTKPNLEGVKVQAGDYNQRQLEAAVDQPKLVGDIVQNWLRLASDRPTVIFCSGVKHSRHVAQALLAQSITAEHLDGNTPTSEREAILNRVRYGMTQVLTNVYVASYGLDIPELSCAVIARPTKSIVLYFQTVGRVLRTHPKKRDCLILDHAGCVAEHGFIEEPYPWSLEGDSRKVRQAERVERKEPKDIECPACSTIFRASAVCPTCGHKLAGGVEAVPYHEADLQEVGKTKAKRNRDATPEQKRAFYGQLMYYAKEKGYADGWASQKYRKAFGVWPNSYRDAPLSRPGKRVRGWIISQQIAYRKEQEKG